MRACFLSFDDSPDCASFFRKDVLRRSRARFDRFLFLLRGERSWNVVFNLWLTLQGTLGKKSSVFLLPQRVRASSS